MNIHPKNPDFNLDTLPLFHWAFEHEQKSLPFPVVHLSRKHGISIIRAAFYAEQMELEAANDNH